VARPARRAVVDALAYLASECVGYTAETEGVPVHEVLGALVDVAADFDRAIR
jgi:hypothetical protein